MRKLFASATMMATVLGMTACGDGDNASSTSSESKPQATISGEVATKSENNHNPDFPTYAVGSEINYEPFSFKGSMGEPIGFEIDLLNAIGKAGKFNVTFINHSRGEVLETLNNNKFVIWASTLSVSPERKEKMDFSEPYIDFTREVMILDKPENSTLQTIADFKGKKIAVSKDSKSAIDTATEITGAESNVVLTDGFFLSLKSTYLGKSDGTLGDSRLLQYQKLKNPEMQTRTVPLGDERKDIAFAVKKGNTAVLQQINEGLAAVKADGTYDRLVEKWFGQQAKK